MWHIYYVSTGKEDRCSDRKCENGGYMEHSTCECRCDNDSSDCSCW